MARSSTSSVAVRRSVPPGAVTPALLSELALEYPDAPARAVTLAVDHAYRTAQTLAVGGEAAARVVAALAHECLESRGAAADSSSM